MNESGSRGANGGRALDQAAALVLALAAAGVGFGVKEAGVFRVPPAVGKMEMMGVVYDGASAASRAAAELYELRGVMGTFGAVLGLAMGLAGGRAARSWRGAVIAAGCGAVAGAAVCVVAASVAVPIYERAEAAAAGDLPRSVLLHLALWAPLGAVAGAAHTLPKKRGFLAAIIAGAAGAALGAVVYDLVGGFAFPFAETGKPMAAEAAPRLLAFLFVALGVWAGLALAASAGKPSPAPTDHQ